MKNLVIALGLLLSWIVPAIAQQIKSGSYQSAGAGQYGLSISTNTQLTVPTGTICAYITVETANVRRTSDGVSASTTCCRSCWRWQPRRSRSATRSWSSR